MIRFSVALLLTLITLAAQAGALRVENAWARANPPVVPNGAVYMTIVNDSDEPDRLLGIEGAVARRIELHESRVDNGVMTMRAVSEPLQVPADGTLTLAPGGLHVMLVGLVAPLTPGQSFPLILRFEKAGELPVTVSVRATAP